MTGGAVVVLGEECLVGLLTFILTINFAKDILQNWEAEKANFIFVIPNEYEMMLTRITTLEQTGKTHDEAELQAFYEHKDGKLVAGVAK
ncbi:Glutamate synthase [NADPH] large chain [Listeria monocytogenes N53-1]|nr:Glutamate synthase [NADPH] large chain [Listeria monocytogenes N53-1]